MSSQIRITFRNHIENCRVYGFNKLGFLTRFTEKSAICVFLLIVQGDSIRLVTLTAIFLSNTFEIEKDIMRLATSVIFCTGITVPDVFHSHNWSTKAVIFLLSLVVSLYCRGWKQVGVWHLFRWLHFSLALSCVGNGWAMCSVNDHTVVSHEVLPNNGPCQILH